MTRSGVVADWGGSIIRETGRLRRGRGKKHFQGGTLNEGCFGKRVPLVVFEAKRLLALCLWRVQKLKHKWVVLVALVPQTTMF